MSNIYRDSEKQWLTENPLRQWRVAKNLFLKDVGAATSVGYHTVYRWENGMSTPTDQQMEILAGLMKIKPKNLQKRWEDWKLQRPVFGKE